MRQARPLQVELLLSLERRVRALEERLGFAPPRPPHSRTWHLQELLNHRHAAMQEFFNRIGVATDALADLHRGLDEVKPQLGSRQPLVRQLDLRLQVLRIEIRNLSVDLGNASECLRQSRVLLREYYQDSRDEVPSDDAEKAIAEKLRRLLENERRTRVCLVEVETELRAVRLQLRGESSENGHDG